MLYMVTFTSNIPQMLAYIPYMDRMGDRESMGFFDDSSVDLGIPEVG